MHIYVSLLKQMAPEHLLATFAKICAEILAAASDGILSVENVSGQSVLQVTSCLLLSLHANMHMTICMVIHVYFSSLALLSKLK